MSDIQCVIVTPEKTEVDVRANSVTVPLFDGALAFSKAIACWWTFGVCVEDAGDGRHTTLLYRRGIGSGE